MKRRRVTVVLSVATVVMAGALPAAALDLDEYLRRSSDADFDARQVVACSTPDGVRDAVLEVEQAGGMLVVRNPVADGSSVVVSSGSTAISPADGPSAVTVVTGRDEKGTHDYEISAEEAVVYDGRTATEVLVRRDGVDRARMIFDDTSGALLSTETLNADGSRYCEISMASFDPKAGGALSAQIPVADQTSTLAVSSDVDDLPETVAGFDRVDVYELRPGQIVAYYSDGLFSFTLLHSDRPLDAGEMTSHETDRGAYRRAFGPNQALYVWQVGDAGYALLGDHPLDLQEQVLSELPAPSRPGFWTRFWSRLFG